MSRHKKSVKEKVQKDYPEFVSVVEGEGVESLEKKLSSYAKEQENIADSLENNEILKAAKETLSEISGPYRDAKKAVRLKMKYIIELIKEKGGEA